MIRIENLRKEYDAKTVALDGIDLVFEDSTFVALLGPSGCGKTTTLNCIAGLLEPTSGKIFFGDKDVTQLQPKDRNIGMVFQSYALYPHMKVIDNIAFSLKQNGMPKAERHEKAVRWPGSSRSSTCLTVCPANSRAASSSVFPWHVRWSRTAGPAAGRAHVQPGCPSEDRDPGRDPPHPAGSGRYLHHCNPRSGGGHGHGQTRSPILDNGRIQQFDTPEMLYHKPANLFVAHFMGNPP